MCVVFVECMQLYCDGVGWCVDCEFVVVYVIDDLCVVLLFGVVQCEIEDLVVGCCDVLDVCVCVVGWEYCDVVWWQCVDYGCVFECNGFDCCYEFLVFVLCVVDECDCWCGEVCEDFGFVWMVYVDFDYCEMMCG